MLSNEWLWVLFMLLDLSMALLVFRLFGKSGLYTLIVANIILCNIQVIKIVELFGFTATLGNILYGSIFFATDLLGEVYGKKEAQKGVWLGFFALLMMTLFMQLSLRFSAAPGDFASGALQTIFGFMPRVALGSFLAYLVSQFHDVWAYHFWRNKTGGKHLWLRNNFSTLVSQAIDSLVFCSVAFLGMFAAGTWVQILLTTYVFKLIVALVDTPFIYWGKHISSKKPVFGSDEVERQPS